MFLNRILRLLQPSPCLPVVQDHNTVKREYKYWRLRIIYSMYIGYVCYYLTRKSYTVAAPLIADDLNLTKTQIGLVSTVLYITYGISKFLSGLISDRSNPRYFMAFGLIIVGILNLALSVAPNYYFMIFIWSLNGVFQGWGWPACTKLLTHWFEKKERGFWWAFTATSHNIGGALVALVLPIIAMYTNWRFAIFTPGIISIIMGFFLINRLRDVPQTLGLPKVEDLNKKASEKPQIETSENQEIISTKEILLNHILYNPIIWSLSLCYFFVYVARLGVNDWISYYLMEAKDVPYTMASQAVAWFEIFGLVGMLCAGFCSDKIFKSRRLPFIIISSAIAVVVIYYMKLNPIMPLLINYICVGVIGFCVFSCHMLIGIAGAEFVHKSAAATAHGFTSFFGYMGSAASGILIGSMVDRFSWSSFFVLLIACLCANAIITIIMVISRVENKFLQHT